ncbi:MAG: hypothetical protein HY960_08295 [Ignavibacteriae bacterium]|nr:hypothetical protein [Ignavibacteriota bacterium]
MSETGHAKNVENFSTLISFCSGYGASYNPAKATLKVSSLETLRDTAKNSLADVNRVLAPFTTAVNERQAAFEPLNKLITRVVNALDSSDAPKETLADARTLANKLQGKRSTELPPPPAEGEPDNTHSASQMSFDNRIENLDKFIQLLTATPLYTPNETDLQVGTLTTLLETLRAKNKAVTDAYTPLSTARINRDTLLYQEETGLVDIAADVKSYVKSVFGATSPQFNQITAIKFTKPSKD